MKTCTCCNNDCHAEANRLREAAAIEGLMPVDQRRLVLPSEAYPNSNYFEVTYTCRIPTTCEVDSPEARNHIERNPKTWVSYLEKVESKFVGQNETSPSVGEKGTKP